MAFYWLPWILALHVLAVVLWIGGVGFITLIVLPMARRRGPLEGLQLFFGIEERFSGIARALVLIAGATGAALEWILRLPLSRAYRIDGMIGLWLVFALLLFVLEPVMGSRIQQHAQHDPASVLTRIERVHIVLLIIAMVVIAFAAARTV